jgi:hypothetical protein
VRSIGAGGIGKAEHDGKPVVRRYDGDGLTGQ